MTPTTLKRIYGYPKDCVRPIDIIDVIGIPDERKISQDNQNSEKTCCTVTEGQTLAR